MDDKLTTFIYILLRDHMTFGAIELIIRDHINQSHELTQKQIAEYARSIRDRLIDD